MVKSLVAGNGHTCSDLLIFNIIYFLEEDKALEARL